MGDRFFLGGQTVHDMMRPPSATIQPDVELIGAVLAMQRADVNGLPVVGDDGDLLGSSLSATCCGRCWASRLQFPTTVRHLFERLPIHTDGRPGRCPALAEAACWVFRR